MGLYRNKEGYFFSTGKATYSLLEGMTIGNDEDRASSDILFIMDDNDIDRPAQMVGFFYGAFFLHMGNTLERADYVKVISNMVKRYEDKAAEDNAVIDSIVNRMYDEESDETPEQMRSNLDTLDGCHKYIEYLLDTIDSILK
jgi:hypothetical protein